jgi:type II secretory pathway component PulL
VAQARDLAANNRLTALLDQHIQWLIEESKRDYIDLWHIIIAANKASDADPVYSRMERTLALLRRILDLGFQGVDLLPDGKCRPWLDQGRQAILNRVETAWRANGDEPHLGALFWFHRPEP